MDEVKQESILKLEKVFEGKHKVALFTHMFPDPDAIGSIMGMEKLLNHLNHESCGFYDGTFSHPQNIATVNLLDPNMKHISEFDPAEYDATVLLDTVPSHAGVGDFKDTIFDVVIDHHREVPNGGFNGLFINLKAGSCCSTVYHLMKCFGVKFDEDSDVDSKIATALMVGISTDTEALTSEDACFYDFTAWGDLFEHRHPTMFRKIIHFEKPKFWIEHKASAVKKAVIKEGLGVVGLGVIPQKHRDVIADMADEMVSWEEVNTSVAFAIVDGDRIEGSVRSRNASVSVPGLCKELGGKFGSGGGKLGKGAYRYSLGGVSFDEEEEDVTKVEIWELLDKKETNRIIRIIKK